VTGETATRVPIRYSLVKGLLLRLVGIPARTAYVEVDDSSVRVRMGWAFRAKFDRSRVESAYGGRPVRLTAGVHGRRGRWLVNGASGPIVAIRLNSPVRAWVAGFPVRIREIAVSVADPEGLISLVS
jgi:hypothetical protein